MKYCACCRVRWAVGSAFCEYCPSIIGRRGVSQVLRELSRKDTARVQQDLANEVTALLADVGAELPGQGG